MKLATKFGAVLSTVALLSSSALFAGQGRVEVEIFRGAVDELTVVTEGGLELGALLANDGEEEFDFHEGESIYFRIQPSDISVITGA